MSVEHPTQGPPASITTLVRTHADLVFRNLHRLGVSAADAPDLLQETFLVVHRRWSDYDRSQPIEAWLWGIALGLVRNHRRKTVHRALNERLARKEESLGASTQTPEDELKRARQRRDIEAAINALDPEKRAVFVMFEMEGLSGQAIAEALGVPVGTVHSRLFAARKELTLALAPHALVPHATKEASR